MTRQTVGMTLLVVIALTAPTRAQPLVLETHTPAAGWSEPLTHVLVIATLSLVVNGFLGSARIHLGPFCLLQGNLVVTSATGFEQVVAWLTTRRIDFPVFLMSLLAIFLTGHLIAWLVSRPERGEPL